MATIYIAIETHRDREIGGVFLDKQEAETFIRETSTKHPLYRLQVHQLNDEEILKLADSIRKAR